MHMKPVLTKWATSQQGITLDMDHWTFQKSLGNKGISQGNNWTLHVNILFFKNNKCGWELENRPKAYAHVVPDSF